MAANLRFMAANLRFMATNLRFMAPDSGFRPLFNKKAIQLATKLRFMAANLLAPNFFVKHQNSRAQIF